ncbi:peptide chain release factor N(5)-glutamine methyltransferase [Propioniciclava sinopodophylli]|uniref:Peptide chain release factor N(5)-glutamine methyltransferase n=1 Tax=Propioniciclava sinopodophylli TaxID=1837344 RepID=A0A4Q9KE61_9ACTN|nr:peptide chain release factor N(5)-glutamine methyltransferase [Propioniciclava sinopodophylli]TBT84623.1 peptide chain release factor N(5)-glutamine methyltransferase [Propioniciclava sinopodophylli]
MPESASTLVARLSRRVPAHEARILLAHVLGTEPSRLLLAGAPDEAQRARLDALVERRVAGEPLQHLTGLAPFRTVELEVGPGVFIPRPETEVMTGWVLERLAGAARPVVVELCAGSGAITKALATEFPDAAYHCVELSPDAHAYLVRNLAGLDVDVRLGDMADSFGDLDGTVDFVVANPPYVPLEHWADVPAEVRDFDPTLALVSGADGLDAMRVVADVAARLLRPGGWVAAEHAEVQEESAPGVFVRQGSFTAVSDHPDFTERARFVTARRGGRMAP